MGGSQEEEGEGVGHVPSIGMSVSSSSKTHFGLVVSLQLNVAASKELCFRSELAFWKVLNPRSTNWPVPSKISSLCCEAGHL